MIKIEKITTLDRLMKIRDAWDNLLSKSTSNDLFLCPAWLFSWVKVFDKSYDLFFIALWENNRLLGLVPLCHKKTGPFRILTFAGAPVSDRMDFILKGGEEKRCIKTFTRWLLEQKGWDRITLDNFGAFSRNPEIFSDILQKAGIVFKVSVAGTYYYIPTKNYSDFENFLAQNKTKKSLKRLRNYRNRLLRAQNSRWELLTTLDSKTLRQIENLDTIGSLRGNRGESFFSRPSSKIFLQKLFLEIHEDKNIRTIVYKRGNKIHAYEINFLYNNKILSYQASFDKDLLQDSPGTVTCYKAIHHAFENGYDEYDFLLGNEAYKNHWSNDFRQSKCYQLYRKTLPSQILLVFDNQIKPSLKKLVKTPMGEKMFRPLRLATKKGIPQKKGKEFIPKQSWKNFEIISTLNNLKAIKGDWETLLKASKISDPFVRPGWNIAWWESFQNKGILFFVTHREKKKLSGIFPLYKKDMGPFRILTFTGCPVTDRMDFILKNSEREKATISFWKWLKSQGAWDMMALENLCTRTNTPDLIRKACTLTGMKLIKTYEDACYFIDLKTCSNYNAYLTATFKRKHRNYFRRLNKKSLSLSGAKWKIEQNLDNSLIQEMLVLDSQRSLRGKTDQCFFNNSSNKNFLISLMTYKHFKKITRVLTFRTHRGLHAYLLFFICNNRLLAYQTAFDKNLRELSIGTQLFLESIRFAFENGFDEYDFLRGDEEFKTRFTKSFRKTKTLLIFPETRKGNMLYAYYKIIRPAAKRMYKAIKIK